MTLWCLTLYSRSVCNQLFAWDSKAIFFIAMFPFNISQLISSKEANGPVVYPNWVLQAACSRPQIQPRFCVCSFRRHAASMYLVISEFCRDQFSLLSLRSETISQGRKAILAGCDSATTGLGHSDRGHDNLLQQIPGSKGDTTCQTILKSSYFPDHHSQRGISYQRSGYPAYLLALSLGVSVFLGWLQTSPVDGPQESSWGIKQSQTGFPKLSWVHVLVFAPHYTAVSNNRVGYFNQLYSPWVRDWPTSHKIEEELLGILTVFLHFVVCLVASHRFVSQNVN